MANEEQYHQCECEISADGDIFYFCSCGYIRVFPVIGGTILIARGDPDYNHKGGIKTAPTIEISKGGCNE